MPIVESLTRPSSSTDAGQLKDFTIIDGQLYYRGGGGVLARAISEEEAKIELERIHESTCADNDVSLYWRIQRQGYYWPSMAKDAARIQQSCPKCQELVDINEALFVQEGGDCRQLYLNYLQHQLLPPNRTDAAKIQKKSTKFFVEEGELFRKRLSGAPLRCLAGDQITTVLQEVHSGECGEHQGGSRLANQIMHLGYYWPTMEGDSLSFARRCQACQLHGNRIHAPAVELHSLATPWPFHTWAFDLVGPINPPSRGNIWVLATTECYTKWVEAIPLKRATGPAVSNFIRDNIFCRFGIPKRILSDNGTPFINSSVRELCEKYGVNHIKSTPYYPQGNGQAEATNKTLMRILSRMVYDEPKRWADFIPLYYGLIVRRKELQHKPRLSR